MHCGARSGGAQELEFATGDRRALTETRQPSAVRIGTTSTVICHAYLQFVAVYGNEDVDPRGVGMADGVRDAFAGHEVGSCLDRGGMSAPVSATNEGRHRAAFSNRTQRRNKAPSGEDGGMDTAGEIAELSERSPDVGDGTVDLGGDLGRRRRILGMDRPSDVVEVHTQSKEPLLRAVVYVSFDPPALCVRGFDGVSP